MKNNQIIGVFDSGIGGLTVLVELVKVLPTENYIYYGDGKSCPLGNKSTQEILEVTDNAVCYLVQNGAKIIVIACNTATSVAKDYLRAKYDIDIVAMEPAIKPALTKTKTGVVGVLATHNTIHGSSLEALCNRWKGDKKIILRSGDGLVEMVENNKQISSHDKELITTHIENLISEGVDEIVLGCTHYPFLEKEMENIIGNRDVEIINPAPYIAARVEAILEEKDLKNMNGEGHILFVSSLDEEYNSLIENKFIHLSQLKEK